MKRYESWIGRARSSYELSKATISKNIYFEDLCYQAQQAVEKAIKGLLIYYNVEPKFTHNIDILLEDLGLYTEISTDIKKAIDLTRYAIKTRYPGEYDDVTREEYEESIKIAETCLEWVENKIKENNI
jgi:HEPN domain-containing protein